ncbi:MAG: hypothetical protein ABDH20_03875 [Thermus sp.]
MAKAASEAMRERNPGSIVLTASRVYLGNLGQADCGLQGGGGGAYADPGPGAWAVGRSG